MSSASRRPFTARSSQSLLPVPSPARSLKPLPKRARSPDSAAYSLGSLIKRHKPATSNANPPLPAIKKERKADYAKLKAQQRAEREQQRLEFKEKYRRAFPGWTFYLDTESIDPPHLESFQTRIVELGGKIDPFFCRASITHVISDRPVPSELDVSEKENQNTSKAPQPMQAVKSPAKSRARPQDGEEQKQNLVAKALSFGHKIWNTAKLESVLLRCLEEPATVPTSLTTNLKPRNSHHLSKLLQSERIHGLSERDPTQKRHDFRYFARGSHYLLIEDMNGELSTVAAHEYPAYKEREGEKTPWPTLYCHPHARGPFIPFDDKEKKRWDRLQHVEEREREERRARCQSFFKKQQVQKRTEHCFVARKAGDLRRSVSMNNLRNATHEDPFLDHDVEGDAVESANASGYLASGFTGYMAASGNSVGITSTTGTTSTANYTSRNLQIPSNLSGRMRQEVVMRKQVQEKLVRTNTMGPPVDVPQRPSVLKKSKSTNTLKLPKREEGSKPGYCESCRQKFEDFKEHIHGRRHRKFAEDDGNFEKLDNLLKRVQRRTLEERETLYGRRVDICREQGPDSDVDSIAIDD